MLSKSSVQHFHPTRNVFYLFYKTTWVGSDKDCGLYLNKITYMMEVYMWKYMWKLLVR